MNQYFINCSDDSANGGYSKRVFAVTDKPSFIVNIGFNIDAYRPLPVVSTRGYVDHPYVF